MSTIKTITLPKLGDMPTVIKKKRDLGAHGHSRPYNDESLGWCYWDRIWPSEVALATYVIRRFYPTQLAGKTVLEIGCGTGIAGVAAARLGAFTMFSDMVPIVLDGVRETCGLNHVSNFDTCVLDWEQAAQHAPRYDVVLGSEVFYDHKNLPGIAHLLQTVLKPGGMGLFCDPNRVGVSTIEYHFQQRFTMSVEREPFDETLRKHTDGNKSGYIYTFSDTPRPTADARPRRVRTSKRVSSRCAQ